MAPNSFEKHKDNSSEMLSVRVGDQIFALDIMMVREIRGWIPSTPLPQAPPYIRGMINLRGAVLPILDVAVRMDWEAKAPDSSSVVVVVEVEGVSLGLLVDAVCDIVTFSADQIQPMPKVGKPGVAEMASGVVMLDGEIVSLLALENIIPSDLDLAA